MFLAGTYLTISLGSLYKRRCMKILFEAPRKPFAGARRHASTKDVRSDLHDSKKGYIIVSTFME